MDYRGLSNLCDCSNKNKLDKKLIYSYIYGNVRYQDVKVPISNSECFKNKKKYENQHQYQTPPFIQRDPSINMSSIKEFPALKTLKENIPYYIKVKQIFIGNLYHLSIIARNKIPRNTRLGFYRGKKIRLEKIFETKINFDTALEVYKNGYLSEIIDGDEDDKNWVKYISKARNIHEQNVIIYYDAIIDEMVFETCVEIDSNTELLAWYPFEEWKNCLYPNKIENYYYESTVNKTESPAISTPIILNTQKDNVEGLFNSHNSDNQEDFMCEKCGSVFSSLSYLTSHKKYTACADGPDRTFACHLCTRTFEKNERLRVHIRQVHDKIKPYVCNVCGKDFTQSSSLNKHLRIHNGIRPYKCCYCSKDFTASSILTTHMRQHTGEKPFKCTICGKKFASHAAHYSHIRRVHNIEPAAARNLNKSQHEAKNQETQ